jgi:heptaprenyl diphosphate synthase
VSDPISAALALVADDMARFGTLLERALEPQKEYLTRAEHELYRRGKRLRPLMLLLSAHLARGGDERRALPDKVVQAAVSLEMLHVATLIHDDIVDASPLRRGLTTVYADRGTEMAVLIGDMQFIQAVRGFADNVENERDMALVRIVLDTGFNICRGEIDELQTDPDAPPDVLRNRYLRTVDRKTAMLFGLACESGALLMNAGTRATYFVSRFGRAFGRAFQIMDDLLDCVRAASDSGKPQGADLARRRLSLPIVYALAELPADHAVQRIVRGARLEPEELKAALDDVVLSAGYLRAYSEAREAVAQGVNYLEPFPDGPYRRALADIAAGVVDRRIDSSSF